MAVFLNVLRILMGFLGISSYISSKEDKHKKEVMLLSVNCKHSDYTSFKPEKQQPQMAADNSVSTASEGQPQRPTFEVVEIYKSSVSVNPILEFGKAKAIVVLDATLCDAPTK
ncbi:hypothetical protein C5167_013573 [Papaver somniferum]|uniref:Uncharacterized protein n=1 Tax=Papaver somniferum TaxID=3469 RepID=A0A4Y7J4P2_PAPSO|nr:hypothetical protein C5167_013573 [Papaver somniferum]